MNELWCTLNSSSSSIESKPSYKQLCWLIKYLYRYFASCLIRQIGGLRRNVTYFYFDFINLLARREEGEGANRDRRLVPYHGKCKRIQANSLSFRIQSYRFFFSKRNIIFLEKKERRLVNKTVLYYYG